MHPVLSDLTISHSHAAADAALKARQDLRLAHAAGKPAAGLGAIVNAVRQFIDPRRYALAIATAPERPRQATRPQGALAMLADRRPTAQLDLPVAA